MPFFFRKFHLQICDTMWYFIFRFQRYYILTVAVKVLMKIETQMKKCSKSHGKFVEVNWVLQKMFDSKPILLSGWNFCLSHCLSEVRGSHAIIETYGIQGFTEQIWSSQSKHKISFLLNQCQPGTLFFYAFSFPYIILMCYEILNTRTIQKIRFHILFLLKGFLHWVGKHMFT